jgi:hypothetical protein
MHVHQGWHIELRPGLVACPAQAWSCARGGGTYKRHDETNLDGLESDFKDSISYNDHVHTIIDTRISSRPLIRRLAIADWAAPTLLIAYGVFLSGHAPVVFLFELVFKRQTEILFILWRYLINTREI